MDSAEDPEEDLKSGSLHSQVSKSNNPAGTFNTLSSLSTLKPGMSATLHSLVNLLLLFLKHFT